MSTLDMSLGEIAAKNRPARGGRGGRGGSAPASRGGRGGAQSSGNGGEAGPMRNKQRNLGQQAKTPYQRAPQQQYAPIQYAAPINLGFAASNPVGGKWTHDLYSAPAPQQQQVQQVQPPQPVKKLQGDTIHVSNLASDVSDEDVREIFERIGAVKSCTVNFNSKGVSTGTATVTFVRKPDAEKAVAEYDEAEVDGRPIKLRLVGSIVTAPVIVPKQKPQVVTPQVVQAAPQIAYLPQQLFAQQPIQYQQQVPRYQQERPQRPMKQVVSRGGSKATRGGAATTGRGGNTNAAKPARGGAAARGGRGGKQQTPATSEDLDKEMDSYHSAAAPPAPAASGQPTTV